MYKKKKRKPVNMMAAKTRHSTSSTVPVSYIPHTNKESKIMTI